MFNYVGILSFAGLALFLVLIFHLTIRKEKKDMQKLIENDKRKQKEWEKSIFQKVSEAKK